MIPYGRQDITQADIEAVVDGAALGFPDAGAGGAALRGGGRRRACGARHAVAVNSATVGAAHRLPGARASGRAICCGPCPTPSSRRRTARATAARRRLRRHRSAHLEHERARRCAAKLAQAQTRRHGCPRSWCRCTSPGSRCDMEASAALARALRLPGHRRRVARDRRAATTASRSAAAAGRDITVFSFHPVKIITTGEGGMALTNDAALAERMALLRSHGITRDAGAHATRARRRRRWYYEQQMLGFNYRMTDMQAALGAEPAAAAGRVRRAPPRAGRALRPRCCADCRCSCPCSQPGDRVGAAPLRGAARRPDAHRARVAGVRRAARARASA